MKKSILPLIWILVIACTSEPERERPAKWHGDWNARWETQPESYPEIDSGTMKFYMNGNFIFTSDSLTVNANGFEGCIFNSDTLSHTQSWYVSNDTLFLMNNLNQTGITYKIKKQEENKVELQLMEDIFVTLSKE